MKIAFLLTHIPNPRMNKRINLFDTFADIIVICTRRISQNNYEPELLKIKHIIFDIDLPNSTQLLKRWYKSNIFKMKSYKELVSIQPDLIYCEGLDTLQVAVNYKKDHPKTKIIFEVADLRKWFICANKNVRETFISYIISYLEKKLFIYVDKLVVTSMKFFEMHYKDLITENNLIYMPNIPNKEAFNKYKKKNTGDFTIGFIGGIRYIKQMKMLIDSAEVVGCKVLFAGGGSKKDYKEIVRYSKNKPFVSFYGKYSYDKDISFLYGKVDCVYSVYDANDRNVQIALPNKLYESIFCELPIIVAKNTYLSQLVDFWGVGFSVSHTDKTELINALKKISTNKNCYDKLVNSCINNKDKINQERYETEFKQSILELLK